MSQPPIKVLITTDIPESREHFQAVLSAETDLEVAAVATRSEEAVELSRTHEPDVVLMDFDMTGMDAIEATRAILRELPTAQVIMLSVVSEAEDIRRAMRAGARDFLIKPFPDVELLDTIRWLIQEQRDYARMQAWVKRLRQAYEALFTDDKPVPPKVVAYLEAQVAKAPQDRLTVETLAVAYARNRDWAKLAPLATWLSETVEQP